MLGKIAPSVVIPWLFSLVTIGVGIWQFADSSAQANREPFLKQQLEVSFEASRTVAQLANETNPDEWEKARKTFWQLYWGPLVIVENQEVELAMGNVKTKLEAAVPKLPVQPVQLPLKMLDADSRDLACAVRRLILASWRVALPPLKYLCS